MSYLKSPPPDEKLSAQMEEIRKAVGFVPNFFAAQTGSPDLFNAELQLMFSVLIREGALSRRQKEYVFLVCSGSNLSTYCVTAHCEIVRLLGLQGPEPEQVALDHNRTDLPVADKALLNFALKLNDHPARLGPADVQALRTYGFSEEQILEAVVTVGMAKFANFVAFGLGTVPDFDPRVQLPGLEQAAARG